MQGDLQILLIDFMDKSWIKLDRICCLYVSFSDFVRIVVCFFFSFYNIYDFSINANNLFVTNIIHCLAEEYIEDFRLVIRFVIYLLLLR